jgi:hypothetical protein
MLAVVGAAGFIRGFTGFGAAMIMIPGLAFAMPPAAAVTIMIVIGLVNAPQLVVPAWSAARWRDIGPMSAAAVIGTPIGLAFLAEVPPDVARRVIGAMVTLCALAMLAGVAYRGRRTMVRNTAIGLVAGLAHGSTGIGGPPMVLYLLGSDDRSAAENRAGIIILFLFIQLAAAPAALAAGLVTWTIVWTSLFLLPVYAAATWAGARWFDRAREALYRRVTLWLLLVMGTVALIR